MFCGRLEARFPFSAACELWRHSRDSISPGWTLGQTLCRRSHSVSAPYPGKSPLPAFRPAARPPSGTTCSRRRTKSSADRRRCRHRPAQGSFRPRSCSTPGVSGWPPVSSAPVSCGKGNRPACVPAVASLYRGYLSCVPSIFRFCRSPRKGFLPHSCGVFRRWHAPHSFGSLWPEATYGHFVQKSALCVLPPPDIPFRTVILFSRCRPSMN